MSTTVPTVSNLTVSEVAARVGAIPYWRIRTDPPPGTATMEDVERIRREEGRICELIDGVLVAKAGSVETSILGIEVATLLGNFVKPRRLGWILGADGFTRLFGTQLRAPNVSFARVDQRPGGRLLKTGYSETAPALAVEVFSPGNTVDELERKRTEFFSAGTELFWIVYPERQQVEVFTSPEDRRTLSREETLDGGTVLPEFSVKVGDIFDAVNLAESEGE